MAGRPRLWVAGLSALALVAAGLLTWALLRPDPYVAPPPEPTPAGPDSAGAAEALDDLVDAVTSRDVEAARALAPPGDPAAAELLAAVVRNAEALSVTGFTARYVSESGAFADDRWPAAVELTWAFNGFDDEPAQAEVVVEFARVQSEGDDGVGIVGFGGGALRSPLWLSGPLTVRRTQEVLVLAGRERDAARYVELAERSVPVVRKVLPEWPGGLVVEVPRAAGQLDRMLGVEPGSYAGIAAVSATVDGRRDPEAPVHVFVNPGVFSTLDPIGAQVVMSHEATHVASGAALAAGMPLWLLEGFADYVALRDVDLPIQTTAGQVIAQVRRDGLPDELPGAEDFEQSSAHLGAAYEASWLACRLIARVAGEQALARLYEDVRSGADPAESLRSATGMTHAIFVRRWRQELATLAGTR